MEAVPAQRARTGVRSPRRGLRRAAPGAGGHDALRAGRGAPRSLSASTGRASSSPLPARARPSCRSCRSCAYRGDFEGIATRNGVSTAARARGPEDGAYSTGSSSTPSARRRPAVLDAGSPPGGPSNWVNHDVNAGRVPGRRPCARQPRTGDSVPLLFKRRGRRVASFFQIKSAAKGASALPDAGADRTSSRARHVTVTTSRAPSSTALGCTNASAPLGSPRVRRSSPAVRGRPPVSNTAPRSRAGRRGGNRFSSLTRLPPQFVRHRLDGPVLARAPRARTPKTRVADHAVERPLNTRTDFEEAGGPSGEFPALAGRTAGSSRRWSAAPCRRRAAAAAPPRAASAGSAEVPRWRSVADQKTWLWSFRPAPLGLRVASETRACCRARLELTAFTSSNCVISFSTSDGTRCILKRAGATACDDSINCFK